MNADRKRFRVLYAWRRFSTNAGRRLGRPSCPGEIKRSQDNSFYSEVSLQTYALSRGGTKTGLERAAEIEPTVMLPLEQSI